MAIPIKNEIVQYLYIGHLVLHKAARAIVKLFDRRFEGGLSAVLTKERPKLQELRNEGTVTESQLQIIDQETGMY